MPLRRGVVENLHIDLHIDRRCAVRDKDKPAVLTKTPIAFADEAAGLERFFKLELWRVRTADGEGNRIVWIRGDFVLVVAVTPEQKIVTLCEYKQAVQTVLRGLPAGAMKKGETPQAAALRELREETGYTSTEDRCRVLGPFLNSPDKSTERHFVVLVRDAVESGPSKPDESEMILAVELLGLESAGREIKIGIHLMALYEVRPLLAD